MTGIVEDLRAEQGFLICALIALAALFGAGAALGYFVTIRPAPPAPPPQTIIIQLQPPGPK
jgi:hypothetical protein